MTRKQTKHKTHRCGKFLCPYIQLFMNIILPKLFKFISPLIQQVGLQIPNAEGLECSLKLHILNSILTLPLTKSLPVIIRSATCTMHKELLLIL